VLYIAVVFLIFLAHDVWEALWFTDPATHQVHFGVGIGTLILATNVVLLSGYTPAFAVLSAAKAADASAIARQYALGVNENAAVDVVEDLNEITTTYTATAPDGGVATASYILSARGYYAVLFYDPPAAPAPEATATTVSAVQR
jgi:hypothetical protein